MQASRARLTDKVARPNIHEELRVSPHHAGDKQRARERDEHGTLLGASRQSLDSRSRVGELLLRVLQLLVVCDEAFEFPADARKPGQVWRLDC